MSIVSLLFTAAHEMLHLAYFRLPGSEKDRINDLLENELNKSGNQMQLDKVQQYSPEEQYDEAHSFIGSESSNISAELEEYYAQYFESRDLTIKAYEDSKTSKELVSIIAHKKLI